MGEIPNALDNLSNQAAKNRVNKLLSSVSKGFFSDQAWEGVHAIFDAMKNAGIRYTLEGAEYGNASPSDRTPTNKTWKFSVNFTNNKNRPTTLYGVITASGAGSVADPLARYDVVAYVS